MSIGLFIPLPKGLAEKFPSLGDHDTSPPHATLLYFGEAPEDTGRFLDVVRAHLQRWPGEITATLRGLKHFDNPDATVAYNSVRFDADVAGLRSSLIAHLSDNGFPSTDRSPTYYYPHVTLAYLPPNSVGEYRGPVPVGSWTFDEVEVWGLGEDPVVLPLGGESSSRVAARYKSKKKIETKDGDEATVYEYGPRQVANRHREKAERVEHLRQHISDLRARVKDDLKSDDPHTRMTALAVSLMDHTCERVGNDDSADNGHYGVTGWLKKHITVRDGKATIKYVGKSGVKHEKTVDDGPTVTALKELCEGRGGGEAIFDTDDAKVSADDVNDYLAEFDVTAKDIRGFRANDEMCKALRAERAKGPKELPRARKEKDEILKAEFKRALETVAEVVGHEAATLRSQYLVPGLEDQYIHDGTVIKSLKVGSGGLQVFAAYVYLSRTQHRGLSTECDEAQDMIEGLKSGDPSITNAIARTLARHPKLSGFRGVVIPAPRSDGGKSSMMGLAKALVRAGVGDRVEMPVVRVVPVESSRMRRRKGLPGLSEIEHIKSMGVTSHGISPEEPLLIVDDVVTTGSTLRATAAKMREGGHTGPIMAATAGHVENSGEALSCPVNYVTQRVGTKTDAQREDEATEKLVKPAPKKKPPRHDLRNERVESDDPDLDDTDDDLSLNFKKVASPVRVAMAVRVAARYLWAKGKANKQLDEEFLKSVEGKLFKTPKSDQEGGVTYSRLKEIDPSAAKKEREKWVRGKREERGNQKTPEQDQAEKRENLKRDQAEKKKRKVTPATDEEIRESVNKVVAIDALKELPEDERESVSRTMRDALDGYTQSQVEDFNKRVTKDLTDLHGELSKEGLDRDKMDNLRRVPEDLYPPDVKMTTFDSKKSGEAISAAQKKLSETRKQREEAEYAIKSLPAEKEYEEANQKDLEKKLSNLEGSSDKLAVAKAKRDLDKSKKTLSDIDKKLENAKKRIEPLRRSEEEGVNKLSEMAAFHTKQEVLNAQVVRVKLDVNKPSSDRMRESLSRYEALSPAQQKSRIENASKHRDELKERLDNASKGEREALKKELDAAEDEVAVSTLAKYRGMTPKEVESDTKAGFIRDLDEAGVKVDDPHLQALLRDDADEEEVSRAAWNLADKMPDEAILKHFHPDAYEAFKDDPDLLDLLRDEASETLVGEFTKGRLKGQKKTETKPKGKSEIDQITEGESPETAELIENWFAGGSGKGQSKKKVQTMTNMVEGLSPENKKRFVEKIEEKIEGPSSKKPEKPLAQRAREFVQNMDIPPDEKRKKLRELSKMSPDDMKAMMGAVLDDEEGGIGKTASPRVPGPRRVAARFLAYSTSGR